MNDQQFWLILSNQCLIKHNGSVNTECAEATLPLNKRKKLYKYAAYIELTP